MKLVSTTTDPRKEKFTQQKRSGHLYASDHYIVLCTRTQSTEEIDSGTFEGAVVHIFPGGWSNVGSAGDTWFAENFEPFEGSVTLTQTL